MKAKPVMLTLLIMLLMQFSVQGATQASPVAKSRVMLKINDYYVLFTAPKAPYIDSNNRFMIPLRSLSELLGARVEYNSATKKATISMGATNFTLTSNSKSIVANGIKSFMDTAPVVHKGSMFVPLSALVNNIGIKSKWDSKNKLYILTGDSLMKTDMITYFEDLDNGEGPVKSNNGFLPVSYTLDLSNYKITIQSKNITGSDLPEGVEDVHPYFIFGNSAVFDTKNRKRPAVEKDGIVEYTWKFTPTIVNNNRESLKYILVKGRVFDN